MSLFLALITGKGRGCDYTIGCNKTWRFLEARTVQEALKEAEKTCFDNMGGEDTIENVVLVKAGKDVLLDIHGIVQKRKEAEQAKHDADRDKRERAEFDRRRL